MCFWALHFVWMCWPLAKAVAAHTALGSAQRRCLSHPHGFCIPPTCVPLAAWNILVFPHTLLFHVLKYFQYGNVSNAMSASHCSGKVVLYFWGIKRAVISYTAMVGTKSPRGWLWHLALRGNPFAWFSLWLMQRDSMVPIGWGGLVWPVMTPHKNGHGKLPEEASQVEILHPSGCCLQRRELGRETKLPPKVLVEDQQPAGPTTSFLPNAFPLLFFFFSYHIHGKNWCHCREGKKKQLSKSGSGHLCSRHRKAHHRSHGNGPSRAPISSPAFLQPWSLQHSRLPESRQAPENLRNSMRSLSCRWWRNNVVSCKEEEFEVGCRSALSSGGVWRNASWGYIKHWLMLRHHEFWKLHLRNEQNLKLHIAYKSTGTRDARDVWKSGLGTGLFWSPATAPRRKWEPYTSIGGWNRPLCYFREDWYRHFGFTHWRELA